MSWFTLDGRAWRKDGRFETLVEAEDKLMETLRTPLSRTALRTVTAGLSSQWSRLGQTWTSDVDSG